MNLSELLNETLRPLLGEANDRSDAAKVIASRPYSTQGSLDALRYARGVQDGIGRSIEAIEAVMAAEIEARFTPHEDSETVALRVIRENYPSKKIQAIKDYRREMELSQGFYPGLREAKDVIDRYWDAFPH